MAVNLHANHFRFGVDELAESTHGWHANEDVSPAQGVIGVDTVFLLRFNVQETGGTAAGNTDFQFQYNKNSAGWVNVTTTSSVVKAVAAAALTNGSACTKRLSGTGTFESSGAGQTEDGTSGGAANDIAASGCSETECGLQVVGADVAGCDSIQFRLTSPDFAITMDVTPTVTVAASSVVVEADGAASGAGASSVLMARVFGSVSAASGLAASTIVAASLWAGLGASAGVASDAWASGAVAAVDAVASGAAVGLGTATNTEAVDGASAGVAVVSGVMAAYVPVACTATGTADLSGLMAIVTAADAASATSGGSIALIIND